MPEHADTRAPIAPFLGEVLKVAAELARRGDVVRAGRLKAAHDGIRKALCPHDGGTNDVLSMSGRHLSCRRCGEHIDGLEGASDG